MDFQISFILVDSLALVEVRGEVMLSPDKSSHGKVSRQLSPCR
jgi:hypothetical protein